MTPTLSKFAAAFDRVWQRYPEAPRLPEGCNLYHITDDETQMGIPDVFGHCLHNEHPAALALCCTTAMERLGVWWVKRGGVFKVWFETGIGWKWIVTVEDGSWRADDAPSLPSACLAALVAMGGA